MPFTLAPCCPDLFVKDGASPIHIRALLIDPSGGERVSELAFPTADSLRAMHDLLGSDLLEITYLPNGDSLWLAEKTSREADPDGRFRFVHPISHQALTPWFWGRALISGTTDDLHVRETQLPVGGVGASIEVGVRLA